jgi:hypothetical protein
MHKLMWMRILWPSFLAAGAAETLFFTLFDPMDLFLFGEPLTLSHTAVYSVGFLMCWLFCAASSGLTLFLQRSADEVNLCSLSASDRPPGCPSRDERNGHSEHNVHSSTAE